MRYRHQYHAGNFADVHKHVALTALLQALARKDKGFLYLETHAGRGAYDLGKSAESRAAAPAIERVLSAGSAHPELAGYARAIAAWREREGTPLAYPGSPIVAAAQLRPQDRAVLIELLPDEASALERALPRGVRAQVVSADGFERMRAFLPPPERRGITLIDPPYEQTRRDFALVEAAIGESLRRFETGVIAVWYPVKDARDTAAWQAALSPTLAREALVSELWLHPRDSRVALNGSGLLIVNPPYGIAERMRTWLPDLLTLIGTEASSSSGTSVRVL